MPVEPPGLGRRVTPGAFDVPNGREYAVLGLSSTSLSPVGFDDTARDRIQAFAINSAPNAACVNDTRDFVRYQLLGGSNLALWTVEATPGPRLRLLQAMPGGQSPVGQVLPLLRAFDWWLESLLSLTDLISRLGAEELTAFLGFNPYPSGALPVVDVDFGACPRPFRATGPAQVPPWGYEFERLAIGSPGLLVVEAVLDLIQMFNFRRLTEAREFLSARAQSLEELSPGGRHTVI